MYNPYHHIAQRLKGYMPKSLFARALLILVLPTILVQILAITIFYERHWSNIQRHLSSSLAGEVALVVDKVIRTEPLLRHRELEVYAAMMGMDIRLLPAPLDVESGIYGKRFSQYAAELTRRLDMPFVVYELDIKEAIRTQVELSDVVVQIDVGLKRLESSTTYIFVMWIMGSAVIVTLIAIMFLRNQIRPIARLALAAERFGRGQDVSDYRPHGALEVRKAGKAFMTMRARLMRQIQTRTAMLSGISHDLRTPLTRMKLELEMLGDEQDVAAMRQDIDDMEYMITEYLDFARGNDDSVPSEVVDMADWLRTIVQAYVKQEAAITYSLAESVVMSVRPNQLKRAVQNVINNALHYGGACHVSMENNDAWLIIAVEDEGEGIPQESFADVFRPFVRLDEARNADNGGSGLGLAITRDIIQSHGGKVHLENRLAEDGSVLGLTVLLTLPLSRP